jgi:oxygen-dependent protoporphyrinogen oxidase
MKIAILGGGLAGLSAAYELARHAQSGANVDTTLYEAGPRLGGLLETHREDGFVIECGADSWVTEKPWARDLAIELGLEDELIGSCDQWRRTYLLRNRRLQPMPDGMRMMVPVDWSPLLASPLFSTEAKLAYLREPRRAEELKAAALELDHDESVRDFVARHFGDEIADNVAAPLLAGVFGGDIRRLSAQAVMPVFVRLAREQGSLVLALQQRARAATKNESTFTTLRNGLQTMPERMAAVLPGSWVKLNSPVTALERTGERWRIHARDNSADFDAVIVATPARMAGKLLAPIEARFSSLLDMEASSAIIVALAFSPEQGRSIRLPRGFGFLVPQMENRAPESRLMAATFVDQKFPHRVPEGGIILRGFFGGAAAPELMQLDDDALVDLARGELGKILGTLPPAQITLVRRWPDSLPQYAVGHLDRVAEIERTVATLPNLRLTGNAFHGVGMPDIIRQARAAAGSLLAE